MKVSNSYRVFTFFNTVFLAALTIVTLYPVLHVIFASFSNGDLLLAHKGLLLKPLSFTFDAYNRVFSNRMILQGYGNTIFVVVFALLLNMLLTSFGAYFTSRKYLYTRNAIMLFMMITMYFSGGIVPFYFVVKGVGLHDSLWSLILPTAISTYNLIILRTAFAGIPDSLEESAVIDGANHFRILWSIIMPLSKATLAVIALYYMVAHWNSWFYAMIFLADRNKYPLQLVLREILIANDTSSMTTNVTADNTQSVGESVKYAVMVIATLPIMCIYPFLQKYFAKGVMIGAVKG